MKTWKAAVLLLILIMLSLGTFAVKTASTSDFGDYLDITDYYWERFTKGGNSIFVVVVRNIYDESLSELNATLDISELVEGSVVSCYIEEIPVGREGLFRFSFTVPSNASLTYYVFKFSVRFKVGFATETYRENVYATVNGAPDLEVSFQPLNLTKASVNNVTVRIKNVGQGVARKLKVDRIALPSGLTILGITNAEKGLLKPGEEWEIGFEIGVEMITLMFPTLSLTISYEDQLRLPIIEVLNIGLLIEDYPKPEIAVEQATNSIEPEMVENLTFIIKNVGNGVAKNVSVSLGSLTPILSIVGPHTARIEELKPGGEAHITFMVFAEFPEVGKEVATVYIVVTYHDFANASYISTYNFGIRILRPEDPSLRVELLTTSLPIGSESKLKFRLENAGGSRAVNITVSVVSLSPYVIVVGESERHIDKLDAGEAVDLAVTVYIQPLVQGAASINIILSYYDRVGTRYLSAHQLGVLVKGSPKFTLVHFAHVPTRIFPGDTYVKLLVFLANVGNGTAEDASILLVLPEGFKPSYSGGERFSIGTVPPWKILNLTFYIDVDENVDPGPHNLTLNVMARGYSEKFNLTIIIERKAEIEITSVEFEPPARPGSRGVRLIVKLINNSTISVDQLRVTVESSLVSGTTMGYVGRLQPREEAVVVMDVDVNPKVVPGENRIQFRLIWVQDGKELEKVQIATVEILESGERPLWFYISVAGISVALVGVVVWVFVVPRFRRL